MISLVIFAIIVIALGVVLSIWLEKQETPKIFEPTDTTVEPVSSNTCSCTNCTCGAQQVPEPQVEVKTEQPATIVQAVIEPPLQPVPVAVPEPVVVEEVEEVVPEKPAKKKRGRKPKKK